MKTGVKFNTQSRVKSFLSFALLFVLIIELCIFVIAHTGYSKLSISSTGFIENESSQDVYNFDEIIVKSLSVCVFEFRNFETACRKFNSFNQGSTAEKIYKQLHSRSPPIV